MPSISIYPPEVTLKISELGEFVEEIAAAAFKWISQFDKKEGEELYFLVHWKQAPELTTTCEIPKLDSFLADELCWFESHLGFLINWLDEECKRGDDNHRLVCESAVKSEVIDTVRNTRNVLTLVEARAFNEGEEKEWGVLVRGEEWEEHACDNGYNDWYVIISCTAFMVHAKPLLEVLEGHPDYQSCSQLCSETCSCREIE